jgi:PAS domain S-box-containing protein
MPDSESQSVTVEASISTLQAMARLHSGLVYVFHPGEDRFIFLSPQVETLCGYTPAELLGMDAEETSQLFRPEDLPFISLCRHRLETHPEEPWQNLQYRMRRKDGAWLWLDCRETLHSLSPTGPSMILGLAQDVTPRLDPEPVLIPEEMEPTPQSVTAELEQRIKERTKALQQAEGALRAFMDAIPESAFLIEAEGSILSANSTFAQRLDLPVDDLPGRNLYELIDRETGAAMRRYTREVLRSGVPTRFTDQRGSQIIDNLIYPVYDSDGHVSGLAVMGFDITERKQAEEALGEKARELARSNAELEQFAYVASHDLQEPLRMVASFTQLLAERYQGRLDEKADQYIGFAVEGANYMQSLIDDLLSYSRVTSRARPFQPTDCNLVLQRALANLRVSIAESQSEISAGPLPTLMADESQLVQLLLNLIANAIKFHGVKPPHITVSARLEADEWFFSVQDNGIGIEPRYFERIFVIFQRLHSRRSAYPGTGIGLAICKKVVERHGGRIWLESIPGEGTTFYFTLPAGVLPEENPQNEQEVP